MAYQLIWVANKPSKFYENELELLLKKIQILYYFLIELHLNIGAKENF